MNTENYPFFIPLLDKWAYNLIRFEIGTENLNKGLALMIIAFCLIVFGILCFVVVHLMNKGEKRDEVDRKRKVDELIKEKGIHVAKRFDSKLSYTLIHDSENKCIWCLRYSDKNPDLKLNYRDIVQVDYKEDDESVISTSRSSQLGGALVGGVLAGGVGAAIGGLSGKKKQQRLVRTIKLVFTVDDLENPVYTIIFANFKDPVAVTDYRYVPLQEEAFGWFKLCEVIIKRTAKEQNENEQGKEPKEEITE